MVRVIIKSGIYRSASCKEIQLSTVRWLVDKRAFEFTMGLSDGFYETSLTPSIKIEKLSFESGFVEIVVKSKEDVETLADELVSMDSRCRESCLNVRM